ncbi:Dihydrdoorotate oxidase B, electron transfer subunit [Bacteroidales bacterium Barb6]|nr:Dihydrdoorotate oxidase B, electron transfer subunit [Bacteroidales bacterium Barb6]
MKYLLDLKVKENTLLYPNYTLLKLTSDTPLPTMLPGQFVEVRIDHTPSTFLRRPISINFVDKAANELWLLVQLIGDGTRRMAAYTAGETVNVMLPLGNGFSLPQKNSRPLLIGGGAGTAPLLYLGDTLAKQGFNPCFLLGARSREDLMQQEAFHAAGEVYVTTEDGSAGEKGYVTDHSILQTRCFDRIYTCGPKPMMKAVAKYAALRAIDCEASLENTMACGIGACLCCVEKLNNNHNVCVCTEGPVFNINKLSWLN